MSQVYVHGAGVVSPAGWGLASFRQAIRKGTPWPIKELQRPGWENPLRLRRVPSPSPKPLFLSHGRLRRSSPITQFAVAAALEALGNDTALIASRSLRLGIVFCVFSGCVNYSRRFYDETLRDPMSASPLIFPETVFNAPSSHLAALLGTTAINYTLVGDPASFLQGVALAAQWLEAEPIDACLVVGAEEADWLTADAYRLFDRRVALSEGAGALYLSRRVPPKPMLELRAITDPHPFTNESKRRKAIVAMAESLPSGHEKDLLCDSCQGNAAVDKGEQEAWKEWGGARLSIKAILGEGLMAAAAWQCVAAVDAIKEGRHPSAVVSTVGCNAEVIGAHFA